MPNEVVGLGDSVPAGSACSCTSYVELVAQQIGRDLHRPVTADNLAVPGATSSDLLRQLQQAPTVERLRRTDVVIVTIGANDLEEGPLRDGCPGLAPTCFRDAAAATAANLRRILKRVRSLTPAGASVAVTGYWNVFQDGAVARSLGAGFVRNSDLITRDFDARLSAAAAAYSATYVDVYTPFKGDGDRDDTALLAADGDHPNASGHRVIFTAVMTALRRVGCRC